MRDEMIEKTITLPMGGFVVLSATHPSNLYCHSVELVNEIDPLAYLQDHMYPDMYPDCPQVPYCLLSSSSQALVLPNKANRAQRKNAQEIDTNRT
jgi:hypothetical protein